MKSLFTLVCLLCLCVATIDVRCQDQLDSLAQDTVGIVADSLAVIDSLAPAPKAEKKESLVRRELDFINYLVSQSQYDDALYVLIQLETKAEKLTAQQLDSIHYFKGWIHYFKQNFDPSIASFRKVDSSSTLFVQAAFYTAFCQLYVDRPSEARESLEHLDVQGDSMLEEFRHFQLAGIAALERDFEAHRHYMEMLTGQYYLFAAEEQNIANHANDLMNYKKKSPFVAGLLSALVPGLGKFYAGYRGLPFGAMFMNLPLMAVAIETAIIAGLLSPPFLILGSVFAVFYIGNIWGSVLSVTAKKREDYAQIDYNIKYDLHVALRRVLE